MDLSERRRSAGTRHPWEQARARFFDRLTTDLVRPTGPVDWLDVGAGDAWLGVQIADSLPTGSSMVCWDTYYTALDLDSLAVSAPAVRFTAEEPSGRFDVISLLDVLEHVDDDEGLLRPLVEHHLADDGTVIVSVPAYQRLFTAHDTALAHFRRYSPAECRAVLTACGLRIDDEGGLFSTLLAPRAAQKAIERVRPPSGDTAAKAGVGGWEGGALLTRSMTFVLDTDAALSRWVSARGHVLPGLSYWAVCRRAT